MNCDDHSQCSQDFLEYSLVREVLGGKIPDIDLGIVPNTVRLVLKEPQQSTQQFQVDSPKLLIRSEKWRKKRS
jgi:hypothetical protein